MYVRPSVHVGGLWAIDKAELDLCKKRRGENNFNFGFETPGTRSTAAPPAAAPGRRRPSATAAPALLTAPGPSGDPGDTAAPPAGAA